MQKKQEEQQAQIEASKQTVSMLVIDKKRMPLKESVSTDGHRPDTEASPPLQDADR